MEWLEFTKLSNKEKCKLVWEWLAETGEEKTSSFFIMYLQNATEVKFKFPENYCYACEETLRISKVKYNDSDKGCNICPITWAPDRSTGRVYCGDPASPYSKWVVEDRPEFKKAWAKEIVKCIETWEEDNDSD